MNRQVTSALLPKSLRLGQPGHLSCQLSCALPNSQWSDVVGRIGWASVLCPAAACKGLLQVPRRATFHLEVQLHPRVAQSLPVPRLGLEELTWNRALLPAHLNASPPSFPP